SSTYQSGISVQTIPTTSLPNMNQALTLKLMDSRYQAFNAMEKILSLTSTGSECRKTKGDTAEI
ncbi:MAG: hypothetical protein ACOYBW_11465, partial [Fluviibacter phosphoraccumulans]